MFYDHKIKICIFVSAILFNGHFGLFVRKISWFDCFIFLVIFLEDIIVYDFGI